MQDIFHCVLLSLIGFCSVSLKFDFIFQTFVFLRSFTFVQAKKKHIQKIWIESGKGKMPAKMIKRKCVHKYFNRIRLDTLSANKKNRASKRTENEIRLKKTTYLSLWSIVEYRIPVSFECVCTITGQSGKRVAFEYEKWWGLRLEANRHPYIYSTNNTNGGEEK